MTPLLIGTLIDSIMEGGKGSGVHGSSGFLDENGEPLLELNQYKKGFAKVNFMMIILNGISFACLLIWSII